MSVLWLALAGTRSQAAEQTDSVFL